jgi:prolyl-tRNA editing enzyme YbaK/EbsC (Cys-tRNA(Pro) deacylase)
MGFRFGGGALGLSVSPVGQTRRVPMISRERAKEQGQVTQNVGKHELE